MNLELDFSGALCVLQRIQDSDWTLILGVPVSAESLRHDVIFSLPWKMIDTMLEVPGPLLGGQMYFSIPSKNHSSPKNYFATKVEWTDCHRDTSAASHQEYCQAVGPIWP
ncbi:hypothetical protein TNCV_2932441 [Trichonephila clavipes]|nr:hypothetical protein TNCV_2932441 [Trichonephila clavipes]